MTFDLTLLATVFDPTLLAMLADSTHDAPFDPTLVVAMAAASEPAMLSLVLQAPPMPSVVDPDPAAAAMLLPLL
jgi:hypothetical protein